MLVTKLALGMNTVPKEMTVHQGEIGMPISSVVSSINITRKMEEGCVVQP